MITVAPVTDAMMARAPRLRFIQKGGTGYEKIDTARFLSGVAIAAADLIVGTQPPSARPPATRLTQEKARS
jgi:phosphoglycerate dehydrogenase-like enzyme